jgi:lipoic acid synthetase
LLKKTKKLDLNIKTKSGIILGLGETKEQIINTFNDLRLVGCNFLTIGQYLQPSPNHAPVKKYWQPAEFSDLQKIAESLGFEKVNAGPLVRSSYNAWKNTI